MSLNKFPQKPILLVDDEESFLHSLGMILRVNNINNVEICSDSGKVLKLIEQKDFQLILLDLFMPNISGSELLPLIANDFPHIPVIMVTAVEEIDTVVNCMKNGAFDYLVKPVSEERLTTSLKRAVEHYSMQNQIELLSRHLLSDKLSDPDLFSSIVTKNKRMLSIFKYIEAVAPTPLPILITGETGVGKELIVQAVHKASKLPGKMVSVNVAGLDDNLLSDTLFGHKRGAFTGAEQERGGLIKQAENGSLFLDEIGDLKIESQIKLLRLLQDGSYYSAGSDIEKYSNARIILATNQNLETLAQEKLFRKDLYYRLKSHHIHIPPLKERKEDIPLLTARFLEEAAQKLNKKRPSPPRELYNLLNSHHFPGNIRELEGMVYDAVSRAETGKLSLETFKRHIGYGCRSNNDHEMRDETDSKIIYPDTLPTLKQASDALVQEALDRAEGNQSLAAEMLGISRAAIYKRLKRSDEI